MPGLVYEEVHACGRCTLIFDDEGQCLDNQTIPPAGPIGLAS